MTTTITRRVRPAAMACPLRYKPERKIYRVGYPYRFRHPSESLAVATGAFLTAHFRIHNNRVQAFDVAWLDAYLRSARDPWESMLDTLMGGVPVLDPPPHGPFTPFCAHYIITIEKWQDIASLLAEYGPVLALVPWCSAYDSESKAWGTDWVGSMGTDLRGNQVTSTRGVLIKGVAWKFKAVRIADGSRPDLWLPFAELNRMFGNGIKAVSAAF